MWRPDRMSRSICREYDRLCKIYKITLNRGELRSRLPLVTANSSFTASSDRLDLSYQRNIIESCCLRVISRPPTWPVLQLFPGLSLLAIHSVPAVEGTARASVQREIRIQQSLSDKECCLGFLAYVLSRLSILFLPLS